MPTVEDRLRSLFSPRPDALEEELPNDYTFTTSTNTRKVIAKFSALALASAALFYWLNQPHVDATAQVIATGSPIVISSNSPVASTVVVDVEGKVRQPGLRTLDSDARVADAIAAAGGLLPGTSHTSLNLAAHLADGQLLVIGLPAGAGILPTGDGQSGTSVQAKLNVNTATESDFENLPGVGPVLAGRILNWRTEHGMFGTIDDLQDVPGIGPKVFSNLSSYLTV